MSIGVIAATIVLFVLVALIFRSMIKDKHDGAGCSGNCSSCGAGCGHDIDLTPKPTEEEMKARYEAVMAATARRTVTIGIEGMSCEMCEKHISEAICKEFPNVGVKVSRADKMAVIVANEEVKEGVLRDIIESIGYEMTGYEVEF